MDLAATDPSQSADWAHKLARVQKPGRYLGGEVNQVVKGEVRARVALCYPDAYEIGMSHVGTKVLYSAVNTREDLAAERVFAPWPDMEALLRESGTPLSTLEGSAVWACDALAFTLQYELSYTNVLNVMDLAGLPIRSAQRKEGPIVLAGGPCALNPVPLEPFIDVFALGDGEEMIVELLDCIGEARSLGKSRLQTLESLAQIDGAYVPALWSEGSTGVRARRRILTELDRAAFPSRPIVPSIDVVHERTGVEIQRGCTRGCRFCQAGYIYRPQRQRHPETVRSLVREVLQGTGDDTYSLLSLSAGDYNCIEPLLGSLIAEHQASRAAVSLPSMRLETLTPVLMEHASTVRRSGLTVAPEAGSARMRAVINKVFDEAQLLEIVGELFARGWTGLKLYFMLGLPTEQREDLEAIIELARKCMEAARPHKRKPRITVSVSSFVPKPHTPFQWAPQIGSDAILARQQDLSRWARRERLELRTHDSDASELEGLIARGGEEASRVIEEAWRRGARMDGWREHRNRDAWQQALKACDVDLAHHLSRWRERDELFPWDRVDSRVDRNWLWGEWQKAMDAAITEDCSKARCTDCGVCDHKTVHNVVWNADRVDIRPRHRAIRGGKSLPAWANEPVIQGRPLRDDEGEDSQHRAQEEQPQGPAGQEKTLTQDRNAVPLEERQRIRLRFAKRFPAAFLGHLDLRMTFQRALRRAKVPVLYSSGFHPHPQMVFSPPLPSGVESEAELLDIEVRRGVQPAELLEQLGRELPEGIFLREAANLPLSQPPVEGELEAVLWRLHLDDPAPFLAAWEQVGDREIPVKRKRSEHLFRLNRALSVPKVVPAGLEFEVPWGTGAPRLRDTLDALMPGLWEDARPLKVGIRTATRTLHA